LLPGFIFSFGAFFFGRLFERAFAFFGGLTRFVADLFLDPANRMFPALVFGFIHLLLGIRFLFFVAPFEFQALVVSGFFFWRMFTFA